MPAKTANQIARNICGTAVVGRSQGADHRTRLSILNLLSESVALVIEIMDHPAFPVVF